MKLSKIEIEKLLEKLNEKYRLYANKYNSKWFNVEAYENRIIFAKKNKMNLEAFVFAEISNFEKLKDKYEKQKKDKNFSRKIDKIIEENNARIVKYDKLEFHLKAGFEISHFYGAINDFSISFFPIFWIVLEEKNVKDFVFNLDEKLNYFAEKRVTLFAKRIEQHINVLDRINFNEIEIEKDKNNFLKEAAFILHEIVDLCDGLIDGKTSSFEKPLDFSRLYIEEKKRKIVSSNFKGLTGFGALLKVRDQAFTILADFRLMEFKENK